VQRLIIKWAKQIPFGLFLFENALDLFLISIKGKVP